MLDDRPGTAVDRLVTLEAELRELADRLVAEREDRLAAEPHESEPGEGVAPEAEPAAGDRDAPDAIAADGATGASGRRRRSGAVPLAIFLASAAAAATAVAALLFAGGRDEDRPRPTASLHAAPAPRQAAPLRLVTDGAATARALRARGVFGVREAGRAGALAGLCARGADVAVLRSAPRRAERAPAAGCQLAVVAEIPVAVTRVVAPLGGCLVARRARARVASPGAIDEARRRAARRAGPRALHRLRGDAPVRGRSATVRRRVARQATTAATVAFDARRRLLPVALRAARGRPCVHPRAASIAAGTYPLTRRLVLAATTSRATAPATRRLAARLRAPTVRARTVATFRAPEAR